MPKIAHFLYCETIQTMPNNPKQQLVNPLLILAPRYIPSDYSFAISFGVLEVDMEKDNKLLIKFVSPSGDIAFASNDITLPRVQEEIKLPPELRGFVLNMDLRNVPLLTIGEYNTEIYFNDEVIGKHPIHVIQGT